MENPLEAYVRRIAREEIERALSAERRRSRCEFDELLDDWLEEGDERHGSRSGVIATF